MSKLSSEAFRQLHRNDQIRVDIFNMADQDANPAPLVVSQPDAKDLIENKFILRLTNTSNERLVLGGFRPVNSKLSKQQDKEGVEQEFLIQPSGLYVNFSDMVNIFHLDRISVSIDGTPVHVELRKLPSPSDLPADTPGLSPLVALSQPDYVFSAKERDPTIPPFSNPGHLGKEEWGLYIWPEKEKYLGIMSTLTIQFENVVTEFYPALRYLDVSWELKRDFLESEINTPPKTMQGFSQVPVELKRPPGFVEPPLPIQAIWLNNQNCIFTSTDSKGDTIGDQTIKNELRFALSNVGLKDFTLDCSRHSRGVPYFELMMTGTEDGEDGYASSAVAAAADLVNVKVSNDSEHPNWKPSWTIQKKIQGPMVKWEIRPDLQLTPEGKKRNSKKILGTEMDATVTFRISNLVSKLKPGVALVYLRFYNMPQHDDGQLVLFLEKRRPGDKQYLVPQLHENNEGNQKVNSIAAPFYWQIKEKKEDKKAIKTLVTIDSELHLNNKVSVIAPNHSSKASETEEKKDQAASLKLAGFSGEKGNWRNVEIRGEADNEADKKTGGSNKMSHRAAKMTFWTRGNDEADWGGMKQRMVIDGLGNVGIDARKNPEAKLDVYGVTQICASKAGLSDIDSENPKDEVAILRLSGYKVNKESSADVEFHADYEEKENPTRQGSKLTIKTQLDNGQLHESVIIDSDGNVSFKLNFRKIRFEVKNPEGKYTNEFTLPDSRINIYDLYARILSLEKGYTNPNAKNSVIYRYLP